MTLMREVEVEGRRLDVRITAGLVAEIGAGLPLHRDEEVIDADGGALIPGLTDHHLT